MVKKKYIPKQGDIVWVDFNPTRGHEQSGRRPALVVSRYEYNKRTNLILACPITKQKKNFAYEVEVDSPSVEGVVLSNHIRSLDIGIRDIQFETKASTHALAGVVGRIGKIIEV